MKKCIFHYPAPIAAKPGAGSALRPNRMLSALREIGYEVEEITGYSKERKEKIKALKKKISDGAVYDFVYSENVNSPTAFSDADHFPRHPFMDFSFFAYCRRQGIPVGLFYRDMYWKFPIYKETVSPIKRMILIPMFKYDLARYRKLLTRLFLPTKIMQNYVLGDMPSCELPPGGDLCPDLLERKRNRVPVSDGKLRIFYVGSLSSMLDNRNLFHAVKETPDVLLTVCTHKDQWEGLKETYAPYMCDRIQVIHTSGSELSAYYEQADISAYCLNPNEYLDLAMPIKVFEAISYGTPLLVTPIHSVSALVQREAIGWVAKNDHQAIGEMLAYLRDNPHEISEKTHNTVNAAPCHTWQARARRAAQELTKA